MITLFNLPTGMKTSRINQSGSVIICYLCDDHQVWVKTFLIILNLFSLFGLRLFFYMLARHWSIATPDGISNCEYLIIVMAAGLWVCIWFPHSVLDEILWWIPFKQTENNQRNFEIESMESYCDNNLILLEEDILKNVSVYTIKINEVNRAFFKIWHDGG